VIPAAGTDSLNTGLLVVDVGNTSISAAVFSEQRIVFRNHLPTPERVSPGFLKRLVPPGRFACRIVAVCISSVVPRLNVALRGSLEQISGTRPLFVDHRCRTGLKWKIDRPAELGADRIADMAGALSLAEPPLLVIDSGTAITFDLVNGRREYLGGSILPGEAIAVRSLAENTAKLRPIVFAVPASPRGTNTGDQIRAGIHYGTIGALRHLVGLYRRILGRKTIVMATGGLMRHLKKENIGVDRFEADLIFFGMRAIHERNRGRR